MFYYLSKFHCLVAFTSWDIGQFVNSNCLLTRLNVINFEFNLIFLIKPFFLQGQKVKTKSWISWERIELLRWNKKHFSSFSKGFHLKQIKHFFLEGESPTLKLCFEPVESYEMFYSEFIPKFDMHISYDSQRRHNKFKFLWVRQLLHNTLV